MRMVRALWLLILTVTVAFPAVSSAAEQVDLLLVLAADVSRSIDSEKFQLQREGYAAAITDPRVLEAIRSGRAGRIGLSFVEWSGLTSQRVVIDWTTINDAEQAKSFADRLLEAPRSFADRTSISSAIEFAMAHLARAPFESARRTIDLSGDGTNNSGREVTQARDEAITQGVTINGLVILSETPLAWNPDHTNPAGGLENYYRTNVVGGPGAFVMAAQSFDSFGQAIVKKMIAEVAQADQVMRRRLPVEWTPQRSSGQPFGSPAAPGPSAFVVMRQPFGQ
jgi:Protein of unknown function (DUF1194)